MMGLSLARLVVVFFLLAVSLVYISANVFGPFFAVPDTFGIYETYLIHGLFGGVYYYWGQLIGRTSAIFFAFLEIFITDTVALSAWKSFVFFRFLNHFMVVAAFYFGLRMVLREAPRLLALALAIFIYGAAQSLWGYMPEEMFSGPGTPVESPLTNTRGLWMLWLLDQAIYLLSAATFVVVFSYLWRFAYRGLTSAHTVGFLVCFFLFLNSHELNLITGGIVMGCITLICFAPRLIRGSVADSPAGEMMATDRSPSANRRALVTFLAFLVVFLASAAMQVLSPSLDHRDQAWPAAMPLFPDAAVAGLNAGWTTFARMLDMSLPVLPAVFLACLAAGIAYGPAQPARLRRHVPAFICLALLTLAVLSFAMSGLMTYSSRMLAGRTYFESHQHLYTSLLGAWSMGLIGCLVGACLRVSETARRASAGAAWAIPVVTAGLLIVPSAAFQDSYAYLQGEHEPDLPGMLGPNQTALYARLDRQLSSPDKDGKVYADEVFIHRGDQDNSVFRGFFESDLTGLVNLYRVKEVVYLPCELGPKPTVCNGRGERPRHEAFEFNRPSDLKRKWHEASNLVLSQVDDGITLTANASEGRHSLLGGPFEKGEQAAVHVEIEIADRAMIAGLAVALISDDGEAVQPFDLEKGVALSGDESGARIARAAVAGTGDDSLTLSVTFVAFGASPTFDLRLYLLDAQGGFSYVGDPDSALEVGAIRLYLVHS